MLIEFNKNFRALLLFNILFHHSQDHITKQKINSKTKQTNQQRNQAAVTVGKEVPSATVSLGSGTLYNCHAYNYVASYNKTNGTEGCKVLPKPSQHYCTI